MPTITALQRRQFIAAGLAGLAAPYAVAGSSNSLGPSQNFDASAAPELRPFQGLSGAALPPSPVVVEGRVPAGLRGVYFRNGPSLMARGDERYQHWFDGDGLVQRWAFEDGGVTHSARFVQTAKFKAESAAGRFLVPALGTAIPARMPVKGTDGMNVANTSVVQHAGRLYALWEGGSAYELDPKTLATIGPRVWAPELAGKPFSAHPKQEPDGSLWNFGAMGDKLWVYQLAANGDVLKTTTLDMPPSAMLHDFAVSQHHLIFLVAPLGLNFKRLREGASLIDAMTWQADQPTRIVVIDKNDLSRRHVLEMPATFVFHFGNAWDDIAEGGDTIRLDCVAAAPMPKLNADMALQMRGQRPPTRASTPMFLKLSLKRGRVELQTRSESVEFPQVDPRVVARRHQFVYYPTALDTGPRWGFNGLMRLNIDSGERERFAFGQDTVLEEHVLVPKPGSTREGEGWLLGMGYDIRRERSFASIFDAQALSAGPLARVWLPHALPYGFHGRFYAA